MEYLRCVVERITYRNEQNGYSVLKCRAKGFQDLIPVVGVMPDVHVGSVLSLGGNWKLDAKYGRQFSVADAAGRGRGGEFESGIKEVFNGDIGVIERADMEERSVTVNFDKRLVEYDISELDELVLAYATTIHKPQGSEIPDSGHAGIDDALCHAPTESDLHGNHPCEETAGDDRNEKSAFLCYPQRNSHAPEYHAAGTAANGQDTAIRICGRGYGNMNRRMFVLGIMLAVCLLAGCSSGNPEEAQGSGEGEVPAAILDIATTQSFTEEAVSAEDMETILLAGMNAPSAMNGQPWHFSAVTDSALLRQIAEDMSAGMPGTPPAGGGAKAGIADAPLAIIVSCRSGSELDAGLACQTMSVAAILMGYGTKIVTSPTIALNGAKQEQYRELLGIPEDYAAAAVLLIGRAADTGDASTSATLRNSMDEVVSRITT